MKILLVCAGGYSTSILVKKVEKWSAENGVEMTIKAVGKSAYEYEWEKYDVLLTGPQISYALDEIRENVKIPAAGIPPIDYAIGNAENIVNLAKSLVKGEK